MLENPYKLPGLQFSEFSCCFFPPTPTPSQVWQIRVDLHLLNHDGNIIDAASIAAIVALCHFRRPDVSVQGEEVTLVSRMR